MSCRQLILEVRPRLPLDGKCYPGIGEASSFGADQRSHEVGEGFLEPQVVPPDHGHEIAEPHVRHFVQDRVGAALMLLVGCGAAEHVCLGEGHQSRVLHGAEVVLGDKDLVVLAERIRIVEVLGVEVQPLTGDVENVLRIEVRSQRRPAQRTQLDSEFAATPRRRHAVIRPGRDRGDVGRDRQRRGESDALCTVHGESLGRGLIRQDFPAVRCCHLECEGRLEVRLLEAGENTPGIGRLVLRVQIRLIVSVVDKSVQPFAGTAVVAVSCHSHDVRSAESAQHDPGSVVLHRNRRTVDVHGIDCSTDEIEPRGLHRGRQINCRDRRKGLHGGVDRRSQIQLHPVTGDGDGSRSFGDFASIQVRSTHALDPARPRAAM